MTAESAKEQVLERARKAAEEIATLSVYERVNEYGVRVINNRERHVAIIVKHFDGNYDS